MSARLTWRHGEDRQKILRAHDKVLEILETENSCTAWYRERIQIRPRRFERSATLWMPGEEVVTFRKMRSLSMSIEIRMWPE